MNTTLYRQQCAAFFEEHAIHADSIAQSFEGLDVDAKWEWYIGLSQMYDEQCLGVIRELVEKESSEVKAYREVFDGVWEERVEPAQAIQEMHLQRRAELDAEALEDRLKITLDGVQYRAEKAIDVLWSGWECDHTAWVVTMDGQKKLVASDHGHQKVVDASFLKERIEAYQKAIDESRALLSYLEA